MPMPAVGTPEYEAVMRETEGAAANPNFNYDAHMAAVHGTGSTSTNIAGSGSSTANNNSGVGASENYNASLNIAAGMPAVGTAEWIALLAETDGAAANPTFNYAAHVAAKNGTEPVVTTTVGGVTTTVVNLTQRALTNFDPSALQVVPLPPFGSAEYKAILLETGRDDLIGFNYAAHIAAKANTSLSNFDTYISAASGSDLVSLLQQVNVNELMASASPLQVQALVAKFGSDPAFSAYLNAETALTLPSPGSAAYEAILKETGRTNLDGFDYEAHVQAVTEATQLISKVGLAELLGVANELTGTAKNDVIRASDTGEAILVAGLGNDTVIGSASDDVLIGGAGNDKMSGMAGNDLYYIDSIKDKVIENAGEGDDTIVAQVNVKLPNNLENVILLDGDIGATGNAVSNDIKGNEGVNKIDGGLGNDVLTGGAGADIFVFSSKLSSGNIDTITDFSGDDLQLSGKIFSKLKGKTDLTDNFVLGQAGDADDFLIYDNGILYYDIDGSGDKTAVAVVALTGQPVLSISDLQIL